VKKWAASIVVIFDVSEIRLSCNVKNIDDIEKAKKISAFI